MTPTFILGTQKQHSWHVQLVLRCLNHNNLFAKLENANVIRRLWNLWAMKLPLGMNWERFFVRLLLWSVGLPQGICRGHSVCGSEAWDKFHTHLSKIERTQDYYIHREIRGWIPVLLVLLFRTGHTFSLKILHLKIQTYREPNIMDFVIHGTSFSAFSTSSVL